MAWSYVDPSVGTDKDRVRLLIGDTNADTPLMEDGEILALLDLTGAPDPAPRRTLYRAAAAAAYALAGKAAQQVDRATADQKSSWGQRYTHYMALGKHLEAQARASGVLPRVGGLSVADKIAARQDTDAVQPAFRRGMDSNPGAGPMNGDEFYP